MSKCYDAAPLPSLFHLDDLLPTQVVENNKMHSNLSSSYSSDPIPNYGGPLLALLPRDEFSTQVVENDNTHSNPHSPYSSDPSYATPYRPAGVPVNAHLNTLALQRQAYDDSYSPGWGDANSCKPTIV